MQKKMPISSRTFENIERMFLRTFLCYLFLFAHMDMVVKGQQSPCPNIFIYQFDPVLKTPFAYIAVPNSLVDKTTDLFVELSIAARVTEENQGSIVLAKSEQQTQLDIKERKDPVFRVNFPSAGVYPSVVEINVNDRTICTGQPVQGIIVTSLNLQYTLLSQQETSFGLSGVAPSANRQPIAPALTISQQAQTTDNSGNICGMMAPLRNLLAINGAQAARGQFPWAAPIFNTARESRPKYICGSTIISRQHLVTAAHCMYFSNGVKRQPDQLKVVPGMYDIDNFLAINNQQRVVGKIFTHPEYFYEDNQITDCDIALLGVREPIAYNDYVRPICLWSGDANLELIVGNKGFVSGWGVTEDGEANVPSFVTATVVGNRECTRALDRLFSTSTRKFCADGQGEVPCNGDSGSGFTIRKDSRHYLRGVVSVGQFNLETLKCDVNKYVVYTDVARFREWLFSTMKIPI